MPELPEVETVKNKLKQKILNKKIESIEIIYSNIITDITIEQFKKKLKNQTFKNIKRLGKWLIFETEDYAMLSHLRMEGKYIIKEKNKSLEKHEHIVFNLDDNTKLIYKDTRKFGKIYLKNKNEIYNTKPLSNVGLEPFDKNMNVDYLYNKFKNKSIPIKTALLDQTIIAGLGNIYDNEVLFLSKVNPTIQAKDVSKKQLQAIIDNSIKILNQAIELGGTTVKSYESLNGEHGGFQENLYVYGKENCKICNTKIEKIKQNGRGTHYCPKCQPKKVDKIK